MDHAHMSQSAAVCRFHLLIGLLVPIDLRNGDGGVGFLFHLPLLIVCFIHEFATVIQKEKAVGDLSVRTENGNDVIAVSIHDPAIRRTFRIGLHQTTGRLAPNLNDLFARGHQDGSVSLVIP